MALTQIKSAGIAADAIDGTKIADAAVANEHIAVDAVNPTQMAHGTDGNLITYDSNGAPGFVLTGTAGQFLKSQGSGDVPVFADIPAGVGGATGVDFNDNVKARFGTGNDAEIYFDSSNLYIKETTGSGDIYIESDDVYIKNNGSTETMAGFKSDGAVELYYDNAKKFETVTGGVTITGNLEPEADNTRDLGSATKRWANVYVGDIELSNEGKKNDVDGSWGKWTIQEGEEHLFLINRRSGKKFRFLLRPVTEDKHEST